MKLFVGLGNPGAKHSGNRHNVGYMAVERLASDHGFLSWRSKFQGLIAEGKLAGKRAMLLKPETYMNESGRSIAEAARFFKIGSPDIVVIHDELDLDPGRVKAKTGGGPGGHNGLRSIHRHIGAGFIKVRIGIGHPQIKDLVSNYVLHDFGKSDQVWLDEVLSWISEASPHLVSGDTAKFTNRIGVLARATDVAAERSEAHERMAGNQVPSEQEEKRGVFGKLFGLLR